MITNNKCISVVNHLLSKVMFLDAFVCVFLNQVFFFHSFLAILKDADLDKTSTKSVRQQLEKKLACDLSARRKEITELVEKYVAASQESDGNDESSSEEEEDGKDSEDEKPPRRAASAPAKKTAPKRKKATSDFEDDSDKATKKKSVVSRKKKKSGSDSDSGVDRSAPKPKGNAFTRPLKLSPDLAALMGAEELPRHDVVKKVWAIIKERNLYDPKNKQFAVCDAELQVVMGVKRFRTFGMLKYLKRHFLS